MASYLPVVGGVDAKREHVISIVSLYVSIKLTGPLDSCLFLNSNTQV